VSCQSLQVGLWPTRGKFKRSESEAPDRPIIMSDRTVYYDTQSKSGVCLFVCYVQVHNCTTSSVVSKLALYHYHNSNAHGVAIVTAPKLQTYWWYVPVSNYVLNNFECCCGAIPSVLANLSGLDSNSIFEEKQLDRDFENWTSRPRHESRELQVCNL